MTNARQPGLTVVELLVVMAIVGLLLAVLLPAVQSARESARQTECKNHLRQIGLGVQAHLDAHRFFPTGGWGWNWAGDPNRGYDHRQPGGWAFNLLPYLEQRSSHDLGLGLAKSSHSAALARTVGTPQPIYYCPSRRATGNYPNTWPPNDEAFNYAYASMVAKLDYAACAGDGDINQFGGGPISLEWADQHYPWQDTRSMTGVSFLCSEIRSADVRDGTSSTYFGGEKYLDPQDYTTGKNISDNETAYQGFENDTYKVTNIQYGPARDSSGLPWTDDKRFGGPHPSSFNMIFCDGSVHAFQFSISHEIHRRLGNRADGLAIDGGAFE